MTTDSTSSGSFVPDEELLGQVLEMLTCALASNTQQQQQATQAMEEHRTNPDFLLYLTYIFSSYTKKGGDVQHIAGLTLKRFIDTSWASLPSGTREFIENELYDALCQPSKNNFLQRTSANALASIVRAAGLRSIPQLPVFICSALDEHTETNTQSLNTNDKVQYHNVRLGVLTVLTLLAEDSSDEWYDPKLNNPLLEVIQRLLLIISTTQYTDERLAALRSMQIFGNNVYNHIPKDTWNEYFKVLGDIASNDTIVTESNKIRAALLDSFKVIVKRRWSIIADDMESVIEFMLATMEDTDEVVLTTVCDAWPIIFKALTVADTKINDEARKQNEKGNTNIFSNDALQDNDEITIWQRPHLEAFELYLPRLVPLLVNQMVWTNKSLAELPASVRENNDKYDKDDVRPFIYRGKKGEAGNTSTPEEDEDDDDDEEDDAYEPKGKGDVSDPYAEVKAVQIRERAAYALDRLAYLYGKSLLNILMPELENRFGASHGSTQKDSWRQREVVMFALGTVAMGTLDDLSDHMTDLYEYVLELSKDPEPLVRSSCIWCMGKYSSWLIEKQIPAPEPPFDQIFNDTVQILCDAFLDTNVRVHQYALNAVDSLIVDCEACIDLMEPFSTSILQSLITVLNLYRRPSSRIFLYDVLSNGADMELFTNDFQQANLVEPLLKILVERFESLTIESAELSPLLSVLSRIIPFVGIDYAEMYGSLYLQTIEIICADLSSAMGPNNDSSEPLHNCSLASAGIDLISGIMDGIKDAGADLIVSTMENKKNSNRSSLNNQQKDTAEYDIFGPLIHALSFPIPDLRTSSLILIGTMCEYPSLFEYLCNDAETIVDVIINTAQDYIDNPKSDRTFDLKAANNAVWALGRISEQIGPDIKSVVKVVLPLFIHALRTKRNVSHNILLQNICYTLGILAEYAPDALVISDISAKLGGPWPNWMLDWFYGIMQMTDPYERSRAVHGLCSAITASPPDTPELIHQICSFFASSFEPSPPEPLFGTMKTILQQYRQEYSNSEWQALTKEWKELLITKLRNVFNVQ